MKENMITDTKKITFPVNLDNLTILLMEEQDTNKLDLQRKIQNILDELTNQNIIREEDGQYHFEIAILLRESIFLSSVLLNSETWLNYSYEHCTKAFFENCFSELFRGIFVEGSIFWPKSGLLVWL